MSTDVGSFRVSATAEDVASFRRATGLAGERETLPLTFPIRWLVTPEIREALIAMVPELDLVLVHEAQMFEYKRPLQMDEAYKLTLVARRENGPDRLLVDGRIEDVDGSLCATVETVLRLFSTTAAAA